MKNKIPIILLMAFSLSSLGQESDPTETKMNTFIETYMKDGLWDYKMIYKQPKPLNDITYSFDSPEKFQSSGLELITKGINTYNFTVIKRIIEAYPIESVRALPSFFSANAVTFQGQSYSLDALEKRLFEHPKADARLHFILNCGAVGCPSFPPKAITPENYDALLTSQTRKALDQPLHVRVDSTEEVVHVSALFQWYSADFEEMGGIRSFINRFRTDSIPENYSIRFIDYDWTLNDINLMGAAAQPINLQQFTPSILIPPGQMEWKSFFNLYTQAQQFNNGSTSSTPRSTYLTTIHQATFGVLPWLNLGLDIWTKQVLNSAGSLGEQPLQILSFPNDNGFDAALSYVGPRFRIAPFSKWQRFSIQSSYLMPAATDMENRSVSSNRPFLFLEWDRSLWINEVFWDQPLGEKFQLFTRLATWTSFTRNSFRLNPFVETPLAVFLSAFPTHRWSIYVQNEWWSTHTADVFLPNGRSDNTFQPFGSYFVQSGLGAKFQVIPGALEVEALYTNFWIGSNGQGAGETFNLGLRWISSR